MKRSLVGLFTLFVCLATNAADGQTLIETARQLIDAGDGRKALRLLLPAARQGDPDAAYWLGRLYFYDQAGVPRNDRESFRWFSRAAQAGHPGGQYKLGSLYYLGRGTQRDVRLALRWWAKAALWGHPEALNNLGALLAIGEGIAADPELGLALQMMAAQRGSEAAQQNLRNKGENEAARSLARQFEERPALLRARLDELLD